MHARDSMFPPMDIPLAHGGRLSHAPSWGRSLPTIHSPIRSSPGSDLIDAFGEALEVRRQLAQMLFDCGCRSVVRQTSSLGQLGGGCGPPACVGQLVGRPSISGAKRPRRRRAFSKGFARRRWLHPPGEWILKNYFVAQIFQITPVPGSWTRGPSPAVMNFASGSD